MSQNTDQNLLLLSFKYNRRSTTYLWLGYFFGVCILGLPLIGIMFMGTFEITILLVVAGALCCSLADRSVKISRMHLRISEAYLDQYVKILGESHQENEAP